ncbi:MAG TPA: serine hydrolase [Anaerolineae bacterium]
MPFDRSPAEATLLQALGRVFPAASLQVRLAGQIIWDAAYGWLDPDDRRHPVSLATPFDLASVTKLFVVTAFMQLVEEGAVTLDQAVSTVLPAFSGIRPIRAYEDPLRAGAWVSVEAPSGPTPPGVDAAEVTFRQLLTHNSGLPAWRPLWQTDSADEARQMALTTAFAYPPGTRVVYSDIGLILLGWAVERLAAAPLDQVVATQVLVPLDLRHTGYRPLAAPGAGSGSPPAAEVASTEFCAWRKGRLQGEVHDENAARLGGVSGHAGLFGTAADLAVFGQMYLDGGAPLLRPATVAEMRRLQAQDGAVRRGLGFALWSPDPEASSNPFSPATFGHTGFTGTSLWIDPERRLVVSLLTNRVYYGRDAAGITAFRVDFGRGLLAGLVD